jgi:hypothetical protein
MQELYANFKCRFVHVVTGIHPDWPGSDCRIVLDTISALKVKEQVVAIAVQGSVEKVFTVDG